MFKMFKIQRNAARRMLAQADMARRTLVQADAARDRCAWPVAAALYDLYLSAPPWGQQAGIWVQLGHARKEAGNFAGAIEAYSHAIELAPDIADTHLHLGHLQKRMGVIDAAITSLAEAERLEPGIGDAATEMQALTNAALEASVEENFEDPNPLRFIDPRPITPEQVAFVPNLPPVYSGLSRRFHVPGASV